MNNLKELIQVMKSQSTGNTLVLLNEELALGTVNIYNTETPSTSISACILLYLTEDFHLSNFKFNKQTTIGYFDVSYGGEVTTLSIQLVRGC